jgi:hypothetical protein
VLAAISPHIFPSVFMTKTITKKMEVAGKKPVESATNDSSLPVWKTKHNRVQGAMWKHLSDDGQSRFTISVSRSYQDQETKKWHNVHYFDSNDLKDIHATCVEAEEQILSLQDMAVVVGED